MTDLETRPVRRVSFVVALIAALAGWPAGPRAQSTVEGALLYYADTDHVQVWSPTLAAHYARDTLRAGTRLSVDVISAASVDLVSAASPGGYSEERREASLDVAIEVERGTWLTVAHGVSVEPDYATKTLSASCSRDLAARRLTLSADVGVGHSDFGRAQDVTLDLSRNSYLAGASASFVLSPRLVVDTNYVLDAVRGDQENAYRYVRLFHSGAERHGTAVSEAVPDARDRHTVTARLRMKMGAQTFGQLAYRLYTDTWDLDGHTLILRGAKELLDERLVVTVEGRGHIQDAASFYRARYESLPNAPARRTADKELGPMRTLRGGLHVEYSPTTQTSEAVRIGLGGDVLHMVYTDPIELATRTAAILTLDLTWEP